MKETIQVKGHTIEIYGSFWNGNESVKYDGTEVSSRRNWRTALSTHSFTVQENGEEIVYEVQITGGYVGVRIRCSPERYYPGPQTVSWWDPPAIKSPFEYTPAR